MSAEDWIDIYDYYDRYPSSYDSFMGRSPMAKKKTRRVITKKVEAQEYGWLNRYYVGAAHIAEDIDNGTNSEHTCASIETCTKQAREILEENSDYSCVVIVKIVRIVTRVSQPIIVKDLK